MLFQDESHSNTLSIAFTGREFHLYLICAMFLSGLLHFWAIRGIILVDLELKKYIPGETHKHGCKLFNIYTSDSYTCIIQIYVG